MKKNILVLALALMIVNPLFAATQTAQVSKNTNTSSAYGQGLTLGVVQKYIHNGMSQDEVVLSLGSPNIVTQDANGKETWVYDKMSSSLTTRDKRESSVENAMDARYFWHGILTFATLGLIHKDTKPELKDVAQVVSSQNTLTIVIKFDQSNRVESYSYHSSKF